MSKDAKKKKSLEKSKPKEKTLPALYDLVVRMEQNHNVRFDKIERELIQMKNFLLGTSSETSSEKGGSKLHPKGLGKETLMGEGCVVFLLPDTVSTFQGCGFVINPPKSLGIDPEKSDCVMSVFHNIQFEEYGEKGYKCFSRYKTMELFVLIEKDESLNVQKLKKKDLFVINIEEYKRKTAPSQESNDLFQRLDADWDIVLIEVDKTGLRKLKNVGTNNLTLFQELVGVASVVPDHEYDRVDLRVSDLAYVGLRGSVVEKDIKTGLYQTSRTGGSDGFSGMAFLDYTGQVRAIQSGEGTFKHGKGRGKGGKKTAINRRKGTLKDCVKEFSNTKKDNILIQVHQKVVAKEIDIRKYVDQKIEGLSGKKIGVEGEGEKEEEKEEEGEEEEEEGLEKISEAAEQLVSIMSTNPRNNVIDVSVIHKLPWMVVSDEYFDRYANAMQAGYDRRVEESDSDGF